MKYTKTLPNNGARQPACWLLLPSFFLLFSVHISWASDPVVVPRFAEAFPRADDFRVTAGGKELPVLEGTIAAMTYAIINAETTVTVERATPFEKVMIRPLSANIVPKVDGNKVVFTLPRALNLSLEFDGNTERPLYFFTSPERANVPRPDDPKVHYYEAGKIHEVGEIRLHDDETLYLEPGAVVQGYVRADSAKNIQILGSGILDQSYRRELKVHTIMLTECENVLIQDVHVHDAFGWTLHPRGCDRVTVDNHKQTGWRANCDGIDIEASHEVVVKNCFLRNDDDCIAVKSKNPEIVRRRGDPAVDDVLIERSVFWNAVGGNALEVGFELMGSTIQNITFRDCDVIRVERGAAFSIHNAGTATVKDITFENVRVEDARDELIDLYIGLSIYSEDIPDEYDRRHGFNLPDSLMDPVANDNKRQWMYLPDRERAAYTQNRGYIKNIVFRDIEVNAPRDLPSLIKGWDKAHRVEGVVIENLTMNGKRIRSLKAADITTEHTTDLSIR